MIANLLVVRPVFGLSETGKQCPVSRVKGLDEAKHVGSSWRCDSYCVGIVACTLIGNRLTYRQLVRVSNSDIQWHLCIYIYRYSHMYIYVYIYIYSYTILNWLVVYLHPHVYIVYKPVWAMRYVLSSVCFTGVTISAVSCERQLCSVRSITSGSYDHH